MKKTKELLKNERATIALGGVLLLLVIVNIFWGQNWIDSDMSAEMIFSNLLSENGEWIASSDWYYSTEFRVLYTQIFMVPLFKIFSSWQVIRMITNLLSYILLLGSFFYFMKPFALNKERVIYTSIILLLPFSETFVTHMQFGNTYMPHVIILFFCFGMFLRLVSSGGAICRRKIPLLGCYILLSMVCGISGVRYMLALQGPLVLTSIVYLMKSREFNTFRGDTQKKQWEFLWAKERKSFILYSMLGAASAVLGYIVNIAIVANKYDFQTYDTTNFIKIFQGVLLERIQNTIGNLLMLFGYIEEKGFLSIRGFISMISFALLIGCFLLVYRCFKLVEEKPYEVFMLWFFVVAFVLNTFVFVFTTSTIVSRYYITVFMFILPILCIYFERERFQLDKRLVTLFLCATLGLSSAKCIYSMIDKDKNAEERVIAKYLLEQDYIFGFATYWHGNILTELTDGKVEVANIGNLDEMSFFSWSSPKKYYEEKYHSGKTFLLLTLEEMEKYKSSPEILKGEKIYMDDNYVVLHFDSVEEFLE